MSTFILTIDGYGGAGKSTLAALMGLFEPGECLKQCAANGGCNVANWRPQVHVSNRSSLGGKVDQLKHVGDDRCRTRVAGPLNRSWLTCRYVVLGLRNIRRLPATGVQKWPR
jgi:hypothetical protein